MKVVQTILYSLFLITPVSAELILEWEKEMDRWIEDVEMAPDGSFLVVATVDGWLYSFGRNGELLWDYSTGYTFWDVSIREEVASGGSDGFLHLLDRNGRWVWKYEVGDVIYSVSLSDRWVAAGGRDKYLYLLDRNGTLLWRNKTGEIHALAISDDVIAVAAESLYFFTTDGELIKEEKIRVTALSGSQGLIAAGGRDGKIYIFEDGEISWEEELPEPISSISMSGKDLAVCSGEFVYFFRDGRLAWKQRVEGFDLSVSLSNDSLAVGSKITDIVEGKTGGKVYLFKRGVTDSINLLLSLLVILILSAVLGLIFLRRKG
jgi:WD40 repeat protein